LPPALKKQSTPIQHQFALAGGDDYELCFTAPKQQRETILNISQQLQTPLCRIGYLKSGLGNCKIIDHNGEPVQLSFTGFDHFAS
jgi:thiamine-monophosphate kinase